MKTNTWYRCKDYDKDSYNCILLEDYKEGEYVLSYHAMIKHKKIVQIMKGFHSCTESSAWFELDDDISDDLDSWMNFANARSLLSGKSKLIVSIKENKVHKAW